VCSPSRCVRLLTFHCALVAFCCFHTMLRKSWTSSAGKRRKWASRTQQKVAHRKRRAAEFVDRTGRHALHLQQPLAHLVAAMHRCRVAAGQISDVSARMIVRTPCPVRHGMQGELNAVQDADGNPGMVQHIVQAQILLVNVTHSGLRQSQSWQSVMSALYSCLAVRARMVHRFRSPTLAKNISSCVCTSQVSGL